MLEQLKTAINEGLNRNAPSKTQPFDEILFSRDGERHSTGKFAQAAGHRWERARIVEITEFAYDNRGKKPFYINANIQTSDGLKEMMLMSFDLHYLAPYVPAESIDGLEGCVIPVTYSIGSDGCHLSAENGYLVTEKSDFSTPPSEAVEED